MIRLNLVRRKMGMVYKTIDRSVDGERPSRLMSLTLTLKQDNVSIDGESWGYLQ